MRSSSANATWSTRRCRSELFLGEVSQARKLGIILLDACRNNPFVDRLSRSMTVASRGPAAAGLARVDNVPRNTLVAMATKADQTAEDGSGGHSPFAEALLKNLQTPGLELSLFFRSVRDTVLQATNNQQEPYIFSSLGAEPFYFNPRPPNRPPQIGAIPPLEVRDNAGPTPLPIPQPTDPDQDPLTVRITGLPRSGEVRIEGRLVTPGAVYTVDASRPRPTSRPEARWAMSGRSTSWWRMAAAAASSAACRSASSPPTGRPWSRRGAGCGSIPVRSASRRPPTRTATG